LKGGTGLRDSKLIAEKRESTLNIKGRREKKDRKKNSKKIIALVSTKGMVPGQPPWVKADGKKKKGLARGKSNKVSAKGEGSKARSRQEEERQPVSYHLLKGDEEKKKKKITTGQGKKEGESQNTTPYREEEKKKKKAHLLGESANGSIAGKHEERRKTN